MNSEFDDNEKAEHISDLKAEIRQLIDAESDPDTKSILAMLYMLGEYAEYVKAVDENLHDRAMAFAMDTNRLKTVSFRDLRKEPPSE